MILHLQFVLKKVKDWANKFGKEAHKAAQLQDLDRAVNINAIDGLERAKETIRYSLAFDSGYLRLE